MPAADAIHVRKHCMALITPTVSAEPSGDATIRLCKAALQMWRQGTAGVPSQVLGSTVPALQDHLESMEAAAALGPQSLDGGP